MTLQTLALSDLRRHPTQSDAQLQRRLAARWLGAALADRVHGPLPEDTDAANRRGAKRMKPRIRMNETVTLDLPGPVVASARAVAGRTHRCVEEVLLEWLDRAAIDVPVELLSDAHVLALRDLPWDGAQSAGAEGCG